MSKSVNVKKLTASDLRGFLKYKGKAVSTEELCKPVDYSNDRI